VHAYSTFISLGYKSSGSVEAPRQLENCSNLSFLGIVWKRRLRAAYTDLTLRTVYNPSPSCLFIPVFTNHDLNYFVNEDERAVTA